MSNDITVDVGETLTVIFDFSDELKTPWRASYQYTTSEFIQIGDLVYECTNAGKTGLQIPENLTTTIGATQVDGTVEWTCRDYSATSGSDSISTKTVTASDAGLTVDSSAISKSHYVSVTFTAVTAGSRNIVCEVVTAAGETLRHTYNIFIY
jgi:hypothetical protein